MFKIIEQKPLINDEMYVEAFCTSLDTKPTSGISFGSLCYELDTETMYWFNGSEWGATGTNPDILFNETFTTVDLEALGFSGLYGYLDGATLTSGNSYLVIFDGTEYTVTAETMGSYVVAGNKGIVGGTATTEPFMLGTFGTTNAIVTDDTEATEHTVVIANA